MKDCSKCNGYNWKFITHFGQVIASCLICGAKFYILPNGKQNNRNTVGNLNAYYLLKKYESKTFSNSKLD